ncbi:RHS repeat domain-containing protein [Rhizobium laguerreae]|uniref:RHS repeat domain-containing protein n=1 Tax=Rhizobium laguerreae TaxID=1076926 RepID=UPI0013F168A6|nr:RHS repeat domain-containing protein [Rhizobium laguerreae]
MAGNLTSLTDPKGNVTSWSYDVQDRQTSKKYADSSTVTYTYETTTSRLKSALDALGQTKQYSYGIDDNLSGLTYLNSVNPTPNVTFTYDPYFSRLATMTDGVGVTSYAYNPSFVDGAQQIAQECFTTTGATGCSHTISYGYDALGRSANRQISGSGPETFQYDAIGRVINHASDLGAFELSYLGETQQLAVRQLLPATSTLKTTWSYLDNAHDRRLAAIANTGLTAGQFTNFTFETTPENLISSTTQTSDATVASPDPSTQNVSFNNLNEITQVSGQDYNYDANGNLLSDGERHYSWDAENRIAAIAYTSAPNKQIIAKYDGIGRRIEIEEVPGAGESNVSKYVWCGNALCQRRTVSYLPVRSYLDEGEYSSEGFVPTLYYGIDQIASVRRVFLSATSSPTFDYDPWGVGSDSTAQTADLGYGRMLSKAARTINLTWFRGYKSELGTWLSRDPLGEIDGFAIDPTISFKEAATTSISPFPALSSSRSATLDDLPAMPTINQSLFPYVNSNPVSLVDPDGLQIKFLGPGGGGRICGIICGGYGCRMDYAPNPGPTLLHFHFGRLSAGGSWGGHRPWYAPWRTY